MQITDQNLEEIILSIKKSSGYDFSGYSVNSLKRRFTKLLKDFRIEHSDLIEKLKNDPGFTEEAVKKITVNTTDFFRDTEFWIQMKDEILPRFAQLDRINIWHPGCSTGQEVYSMMILLEEAGLLGKTNIFASDINSDVIEQAKTGSFKTIFNNNYQENFNRVINTDKNKEAVACSKYFDILNNGERVILKSGLRDKPVYKKMDLVRDKNPFSTNFDIIICRNVIIYFKQELQTRVLEFFYNNLNTKGVLCMGKHESIIGNCANCFIKRGNYYAKKSFNRIS